MSREALMLMENPTLSFEKCKTRTLLAKQQLTFPLVQKMFGLETGFQSLYGSSYFDGTYPFTNLWLAHELLRQTSTYKLRREIIEEQLDPIAASLIERVAFTDMIPGSPRLREIRAEIGVVSVNVIPIAVKQLKVLNLHLGSPSILTPPDNAIVHGAIETKYVDMAVDSLCSKKNTQAAAALKKSGLAIPLKLDSPLINTIPIHASSLAGLHRELEIAGVACSYPEIEKTTHALSIHEALPEHLVIDEGALVKQRRNAIASTAIELGLQSQSGYQSFFQSVAEGLDHILWSYNSLKKHGQLPDHFSNEQCVKIVEIMTSFGGAKQLAEHMKTLGIEISQMMQNPSAFMPLVQMKHLQEVRKEFQLYLELYYTNRFNSGGFWGGEMTKMLSGIDMELEQKSLNLKKNDISLKPRTPMVMLGANGEGKSTVLAIILQHMLSIGKTISAKSHLPANVQILSAGDIIELEGADALRAARLEGKSSFILEVEQMIERVKNIMKVKTKTAKQEIPFVIGDEVGRRTDQLNAMALLGAELILTASSEVLSVYSSHYNSLPHIIGPLLKELDITIDWQTLESHQLKTLKENEVVWSNALQKAVPFIPQAFGEIWQQKTGVHDESMKFGAEAKAISEGGIRFERLKQLGWIQEMAYPSGMVTWHYTGVVDALFSNWSKGNVKRAEFYRDDAVKERLIDTIFNPRWQHNVSMQNWFETISHDRKDLTLLPHISAINEIGNIYKNFGYFKSREGGSEQREKLLLQHMQLLDQIPQLKEHIEQIKRILPGVPVENIEKWMNNPLQNNTDITELMSNMYTAMEEIGVLDTIVTIGYNLENQHLFPISRLDRPEIQITQACSWELQHSKGDKKSVKNSLTLTDRSLFFTGPQGSGKTEAIITIAESAFLGSLWGLTSAKEMKMGGDWEVLPLISVPEIRSKLFDDPKIASRQQRLSSLEKEVNNRIAQAVFFCDNLPEDVRPLIVIDEPFSSTNSKDASEGIRALKEYVESKGGILVVSTHFHDAIYDMEQNNEEVDVKQVGLFDTARAYKWLDGHGKSMGIEVAEKRGMPSEIVQIALVLRNYLEVLAGTFPSPELIKETADILRPLIKQLR